MPKRVLITGGAGFIGTHLARALAASGYNVCVLDRKDPKDRVDAVEYIRADVGDASSLQRSLRAVDTVYHFAALVSVPECQLFPLKSYQENLMNTAVVLEAVRVEMQTTGRKIRVIFSSSSAVYGSHGKEGLSIRENAISLPPTTFYMAEKLASEHAISLYHWAFGIPAVIFRFFNVYGFGQDDSSPYSGVISMFAKHLKNSHPLTLNGGGLQTRDFVSVHDIAKACVLATQLPDEKCDARPINLGSGFSITIRSLAFEMMGVFNSRVAAEIGPSRQGEVLHSMADIRRAKEVLGWSPTLSFKAGLIELHGHFQTLEKAKTGQSA